MPGEQSQHSLPQFMGVPAVDRVRGSSTVRLLRLGQLLDRQSGQRDGFH
jgi:hypothetical protein